MESLRPNDITTLFLSLAIMLAVARAAGELFTRLRQPAIVGEILAGILLGPTALGGAFPELFATLFPSTGPAALAFSTINVIAVVLLLLIAGLEVDLSVIWRQGKAALLVSVLGVVLPFALGFGAAYMMPDSWGIVAGVEPLTFALFFGVALSISALPVIAKTLMDLNVFKTDVGMLIMAAAMFNDLIGWIIFSIVLGMMNAGESGAAAGHGISVPMTIVATVGFAVLTLTIVRGLVHRVLPRIQARLSWPGGVISFTLVLAFLGAAVTEAIGVHAIFGAFLIGAAIGDSSHFREHTRTILHQFVANIFAPIFSVSIGLRVDFFAGFNLWLVLSVLAIAFAGKLIGCVLGGRMGGLSTRESWAIGFGMNARGAMEIILGLLALEYGIIGEEMFIALVTLALVSSMISGPAMSLFIVKPKRWLLNDMIDSSLFIPELRGHTADEVIRELASAAASRVRIGGAEIAKAVLDREAIMGTGLGDEIAIPHARLDVLDRPLLVFGHSEDGIDFDSPDGVPARLIFMLLTPRNDEGAQVQIMGQIARCFQVPEARHVIYERQPLDVIRAFIKIDAPHLSFSLNRKFKFRSPGL